MSVRQNINELDIVHKNLEARLEELETRPSHVNHSTSKQSCQHQDVKHSIDDQHSLNTHQSLHNIQNLHQHHDQTSQGLHVGPLVNNDSSTLDVHSKHDHQPVHGSETITCSHEQEEPIVPSTTAHVEQLPAYSSVDCSSISSSNSDSDEDDESSNILSNGFGDNEMDQPSSTIYHHPNNAVEGTINNVIHKSPSITSVLSDSCVSDSEDERSSFEADGQPCYGDRITIPSKTAVSSEQHQVSMASNLTSVTPTDLSSFSDDESNEPQSSSEDNGEQDEIEKAANCKSSGSKGLETSPATSIVSQSLLNKNEKQQPQLVTDNLRDVTNSLSQPPSATLYQEEEQTLSTLPPSSHTPVHKSPTK